MYGAGVSRGYGIWTPNASLIEDFGNRGRGRTQYPYIKTEGALYLVRAALKRYKQLSPIICICERRNDGELRPVLSRSEQTLVER